MGLFCVAIGFQVLQLRLAVIRSVILLDGDYTEDMIMDNSSNFDSGSTELHKNIH